MARIGIVAAEPSGDQLAGHLITAMRQIDPDLEFEGIGGTKMLEQGVDSWYPMEKLSVMGIVEVLKHLPELLNIRKSLVKRWTANPPDLFIGVDAPDFNIGLEKKLKQVGIPTVQYVCPTIWAWRQDRVKAIRKAVDLILSIFPFEVDLLAEHHVRAFYAGHPLAQDIDKVPSQSDSRARLELPEDKPVLGLLPGSRMSEVSKLSDDFLETAVRLSKKIPGLIVLVPTATDRIRDYFNERQKLYEELNIRVLEKHSRDVMAAADVVLLASGTAAFETMLYRKPMVVAYKVHWLTYFITVKLGLLKTKYIAMPNILAGERLIPEFIQDDCKPEELAKAVYLMFTNKQQREHLHQRFDEMHQQLKQGNIEDAARAVLSMIKNA